MPRLPQLVIVADDLSGALDTAAAFAAEGLRTLVVPHGSGWRAAGDCFAGTLGCQVLVIDTATRHAPAGRAAARVARVVTAARRLGMRRFYKKTDSTLRGRVASELAAFRKAARADVLPFAPAFPRVGRTTRRGHQLVHGVPLGWTAFARDGLDPVRTGSIARLLASEGPLTTRLVGKLQAGARGAAGLEHALSRATRPAPDVLVFDAERDADLMRIAHALRTAGRLEITAGSGGFAGALARVMPFAGGRRAAPNTPPASRRGPLLAVIGSRHPAAARQVRAALAAGFLGVPILTSALGRSGGHRSWIRCAEQAAQLVAQGRDIVVHAVADGRAVRGDHAGAALAVAAGLGRLAAAVIRRPGSHGVAALLASGGDTMAGVAVACGWSRLRAHAEIAPGISLAATGDPRAPHFVGKAGGFGADTVWADVRALLRSGR